jgi:5-methylcytosine-specific restriction endonuclease McrA
VTAKHPDNAKLDRIVAEARRKRDERSLTYRERALKLYPWICGRCAREFTSSTLHMLTVHHRDHDHDNNPADGSNWELLCIYCHENEHSRELEHSRREGLDAVEADAPATYKPFADLKALLKK